MACRLDSRPSSPAGTYGWIEGIIRRSIIGRTGDGLGREVHRSEAREETTLARRKVVHYEGRGGHRNPIPVCVTLGDLILPSVIGAGGPDPKTAVDQAFKNMQAIIEGAGGSLDGIGKITVYLKTMEHREFVNEAWVRTFPDENDRPARHVLVTDLPENTVIQMDVIASR